MLSTNMELDDLREKLRARVAKLEGELDTIRGIAWAALELLENPVFSNDTERVLELLRTIGEGSHDE